MAAKIKLDPALARQFLTALYGRFFSQAKGAGPAFLEVRGKAEGGKMNRRFYRTPDALLKDLARWQAGFNYWIGVALRKDNRGGAKVNLLALTTAFADVDVGSAGHKNASKYETKDEARAAIEAFSLRPSLLIDSGGGFQCYWLYREPVRLSETEIAKVEGINRGLALALGGDLPATDASRILRLSGTWNMKLSGQPRPVKVVWCEPERVYDLAELAKYEDKSRAQKQGPRHGRQGGAVAFPGGEYAAYAQKALVEELAKLAGTPEGGRNAALNQSAYSLGQLIGAGALDRGSVEAALSGTAAAIGLGEMESRATIKSGLEGGMKQPRELPEKTTTRGAALRPGVDPPSPEKGQEAGQGEAEKLKKKKAKPPPTVTSGGLSLSDLGNARRLVAQHGQDLRYCYLSKKWYIWNGKCWEVDNRGEVERRAKRVVGAIYQEAAETDNLKQREALGQWALRSEDKRRIQAMVALAQSEPGIPVLPRDFDNDPWLLNCGNGTIDLSTGELRPHERADLLTCLVPADFDPEASCPVWEKFVYEIQAENIEVYNFLQRILGYALTGETSEQCLFILWGAGANGKSTLINLVTRLLGNYARNTPVETLLDKRRGGEIPIDVARLDGPRLVTAKEVDRGRRLSESLIKELTGQDTISARFLYGEFFDFVPKFKLFLSTNHKPVIKGTDGAIWRRIKLIRFPIQFSEDQCDQDLPGKLWAEAPGILSWLVLGCLSWQRLGLDVPAEVKEATAEFRAEMDILADFMGDRCSIAPDKRAWAKDLYQVYEDWAEEQGLSEKERMRQRSFGMALSERGFQRKRSTHGRYLWHGLGLLRDNESPGGIV